MLMKKIWVWIVTCLFPLCSFSQNKVKAGTHVIDSVAVDIWFPKEGVPNIGTLLVLPGWNFPKDDWCKKSSLCKKALEKGYTLVMPEMGKSTYQFKNYPETRKDWLQFPTRSWMIQKFFPILQEKFGLFLKDSKNYMIGLSTGARGVSLLAHDLPEIFTACAALSGDYEQTKIPQDGVMNGYYGSFVAFPERWKKDDNLVLNMTKFQTPIYLGHGKLDKVIPYQQTEIFYETLKKINPELQVKYHIAPTAGHDYVYWNAELDSIFTFFQSFSQK